MLKEVVALLPDSPGVYQFLNNRDVVIYVGKAKNLKKRVSSYFSSRNDGGRKKEALVKNIARIESIIVDHEADAFLLENNMIKSLQPRYNILLKDDKTYPWIVVKHEPFPRILSTRNYIQDGSTYFGPYASVSAQHSLLELVRRLCFVRTCSLRLTLEGVKRGKFDKCLEYHIGNCKAPCVDLQSYEQYNQNIALATKILKGDLSQTKAYLIDRMREASDALKFEEALKYKERLVLLDNYQSKSVIVCHFGHDIDVFSIVLDNTVAYCNYIHLSKGSVVYSYSIEMKLNIEESREDILSFGIVRIMEILNRELSCEVVVPFEIDSSVFSKSVFTVPKRGDKLKLLELSLTNCRIYRLAKLKNLEKTSPQKHAERVLTTMQKELLLDELPAHIECFDNSNISGSYPVAACVVFRDAKPSKKEYRHFSIKTVVGIDDFASMKEVLFRRYSRMLEQNEPLPQLIVVDGGKGQLSSAYQILCQLKIEKKVKIVGLAKRMEELFFPGDPYPLILPKTSETLKVLMSLRDEAHRFGITFHRNKRSAGALVSQLDSIPSLGEVSVRNLIKHFKTISAIKAASVEQLASLIGNRRAEAVKEYFMNQESKQE